MLCLAQFLVDYAYQLIWSPQHYEVGTLIIHVTHEEIEDRLSQPGCTQPLLSAASPETPFFCKIPLGRAFMILYL